MCGGGPLRHLPDRAVLPPGLTPRVRQRTALTRARASGTGPIRVGAPARCADANRTYPAWPRVTHVSAGLQRPALTRTTRADASAPR
ncbi:hypothetical protein PLANTIT3_70116 [Plantibacter sp. T3]|nr:hypothetical protein PLANTIT3_70116 [Plantibacter sp. T3]